MEKAKEKGYLNGNVNGENKMNITKSKITNLQFILLIIGIQVGIGVISLPRELAEKSGTSSWIAIIIGGVVSTIISIFIIKIREKAPLENFTTFFTFYLGKILGTVIVVLLIIYFLFLGYLVLIRSILFIQGYLLPETGGIILLILFLVPTYQLITGGIHLIAKYVETIFPLTLLGLLMLLFTLKEPNINFVLPIIKEGWMPILKTVPKTTFSFLGIEIIFIIYPYLVAKEKAVKGVIIANSMSTFIYVFITLICFIVYSPDEIETIFDPVIDILSVIEFQYLERLDFILFSLFLMAVSKIWVIYMWASISGISELFKVKRLPILVLVVFIVIIISLYFFIPTFKNNTFQISIISNTGLFIIIGLPIILWLGGMINKKIKIG